MRPAKHILLLDTNESECRVRAYILRTRGYRVAEACDAFSAASLCVETAFDLVVIVLPGGDVIDLLADFPGLKVLAILPKGGTIGDLKAEGMLPAKRSNMDFMEQVRCLVMRKRGPKKARPGSKVIDAA